MARPGISTKNTEKIPRGPKFWTPRIYPQNTPKIPKKYPPNTKNAHFWYFFGIFGVFSWGSRISARGVFFPYFSWKFRVGPSRGSVAGRGVLKFWVFSVYFCPILLVGPFPYSLGGQLFPNSRIAFHHFFRELFLVILSSWFTSNISGRLISRNLLDLHLLPHLL